MLSLSATCKSMNNDIIITSFYYDGSADLYYIRDLDTEYNSNGNCIEIHRGKKKKEERRMVIVIVRVRVIIVVRVIKKSQLSETQKGEKGDTFTHFG